jgi:hypothetical protein
MRYFNKIFTSIKSNYLNDNKYNNSLFSTLRIYFERETKYKTNLTSFGNTFRNSKWSDLHKINIKESFLQTFIYAILTILLCVSILMCFLGKSKSEQYFGFIPFFRLWSDTLNTLLIYINESQSQFFILFFSLITYFYTKINTLISNNIFYIFNLALTPSVTTNRNSFKKNRNSNKQGLNKKSLNLSGSKPLNYSNVLYNLLIIQNSLIYFKSLPKLEYKTHLSSCRPHPLHKLIKSSNGYRGYTNLITVSEAFYGSNITSSKLVSTNLNLKSTQMYTNSHRSLLQFDFNLLNNLNMGKEQRWLVKNSNLTEFLNRNNNMFTQSKKLLGHTFYNNNFSNKNLWLPTKLSNMTTNETLSYVNNLSKFLYPTTHSSQQTNKFTQNSLLKNTNLINLNFFENSRLWVTKKYFFNNQLNSNLVETSKIFNNKKSNIETNSNSRYVSPVNSFQIFENSLNDLNTMFWLTDTPNTLKIQSNKLNAGLKPNNFTVSTPNLDLLTGGDLNFLSNITSTHKINTNPKYYSPLPTRQKLS